MLNNFLILSGCVGIFIIMILVLIKTPSLREMVEDSNNQVSSTRIMASLAMIVASVLLLGMAFGLTSCDQKFMEPITWLIGGAFGAKTTQKFAEAGAIPGFLKQKKDTTGEEQKESQ